MAKVVLDLYISILSGLHLCHHLHLTLRFRHFSFWHFSSASIAKINLLPVACDVIVAATSDVLRPSCNIEMALYAAVQTLLSHSAFETPDPRSHLLLRLQRWNEVSERKWIIFSWCSWLVISWASALLGHNICITLCRCRCSGRSATLTTGCVVVRMRSFRRQHLLRFRDNHQRQLGSPTHALTSSPSTSP